MGILDSFVGNLKILPVYLISEILSPKFHAGHSRSARTQERIKNQVTRSGTVFDQVLYDIQRFYSRMRIVLLIIIICGLEIYGFCIFIRNRLTVIAFSKVQTVFFIRKIFVMEGWRWIRFVPYNNVEGTA